MTDADLKKLKTEVEVMRQEYENLFVVALTYIAFDVATKKRRYSDDDAVAILHGCLNETREAKDAVTK